MRFPNAAKGISKIFTGEILQLIALASGTLALILTFVFVGTAEANNAGGAVASGLGAAVLAIASGVLGIIALILFIVGTVQTAKDEASFKMIIYLTIFNIIVAVIGSFFSGDSFLSALVSTIGNVISLIRSILVVLGIANLAAQLGNKEVMEKCGSIFRIILWTGIVALLTRFFAVFCMTSSFARFVVVILMSLSLAFSIIQYILYISMLSQAKKMLNE